ncbi:DUF4352 domain-containing protein [Nonomuraea candida]|uniref:DUF4352 domain-containing protein n=1 Tax=Nonomuraea candida TaxID=359159 RepID=UPI0006943FC7|nr:DUF4352 domain-containing protein [Nonomuraea candida]
MGYPPQQPHEPYGQQPPPQPYGHGHSSGPHPGYGYQPPTPPPPKRSNTGLILALAIGIPLLLLGGCAAVVLVVANPGRETIVTEADAQRDRVLPSSAPTKVQEQPKQEQPSAATVGGAITLEGMDPGLKMQVTVARVIDPATGDQFSKPKTGNRLVAVEVTLANVGDAVYDDSPTNGALLIDGEGQQFRTTYHTVQEGQPFAGGATINKGDSRKGVLVFEVPESAKLAKLQFGLNSGFADQKGEWTLS